MDRHNLPSHPRHEPDAYVQAALRSADDALRSARDAFTARSTHNATGSRAGSATRSGTVTGPGIGTGLTRSDATNSANVVDLTTLSPESSVDDAFMTQTRHPNDSSRARLTFPAGDAYNEPPLFPGAQPFTQLLNEASNPSTGPGPPLPPFANLNNLYLGLHPHHTLPQPRTVFATVHDPFMSSHASASARTRNTENQAVRRQQQARRDWQRVERRNRERAEEQARRDESARATRDQQRDSNTTHPRPRTSSASSHISTLSDDSNQSQPLSASQTAAPDGLAVDLTSIDDTDSLNKIVAKQQQDAISRQTITNSTDQANSTSTSTSTSTSVLAPYKCAICMESPTQATTTICGHLFCHQCIVDSLKWSEQQRRGDDVPITRKINGLCPVCRKSLQNKEATVAPSGRVNRASAGLVSMEIKTMSRKQYMDNKARDKFLASYQQKNKDRSLKTKTPTDPNLLDPSATVSNRIPDLSPQGPKRKRESPSQGRPTDLESLFGSD